MKKTLVLSAIAFLAITSCDKIEKPLATGVANLCDPTVQVPRKVLIEDLTGHRCNNCPAAARNAETISDLYSDKIIVIGAHVTSTFAAPVLSNWSALGIPDSSFMTDYRSSAGAAILSEYTPTGLPAGVISRRPYNNSTVVGSGNWASAVQEIVCKPADAAISFPTLSYDATSRELSVQVDATLSNSLTGAYRISILLTEDHIVDWQLDATVSPEYVQNYEHRHVLRDKLDAGGNSTVNGDLVLSGSATPGDVLSSSVNNYVVDANWDASNCSVVAFLSNSDGEILQVEETKIIP